MMKLEEFETAVLIQMHEQIAHILAKRGQKEAPNLCHQIKLERIGDGVAVTSPYNSKFVAKARGLRGAWSAGRWVFSASMGEHVKAAMLECYGVSGEHPYETVTLLVKRWDKEAYRNELELFGWPIAKAYGGRDSGAKLEKNIFLLDGELTSGGSVKNWQTAAKSASFEIHNYPKAALAREDVQTAIAEGWCEVK